MNVNQTLTYAIQDLYNHPEYIEALREGIQGRFHSANLLKDVDKLPLLDCFIKESKRCRHSDEEVAWISLTGYKDDWPCNGFFRKMPAKGPCFIHFPGWLNNQQRRLGMHSPASHDARWHSTQGAPGCVFDGFRFVRANAQLQQLKPCAERPDQEESGLTHVSHNWPIRSFGNMSWQVHAVSITDPIWPRSAERLSHMRSYTMHSLVQN